MRSVGGRRREKSGTRLLAVSGLIAAAFVGLTGCHRVASSASAGDAVVLKVASQRGGTRAIMEASGVLDGAPYKVEWSEFPSAQTLLEALSAGAVDAGAVGDAPFMFAYASGSKIKAVQAVKSDGSAASTAIVIPAHSPIKTVGDLRGRRVATGRGSIGHYLLLLALERAGLKPSDVTVVYLAPGDAKAAMASGSVDAWATWGSYIDLAITRDHARILIDSRGYLSGIAFEAANEHAIATKRAQLDDFLHRLARAQVWAKDHEDLYAHALAIDTGLPLDIAQATVVRERRLAVPIDAAVEAEEVDTLAHFRAAGVIDKPIDVHAALDPSFNDAVRP
jgi:sulfonate transport system substrate-binding protein